MANRNASQLQLSPSALVSRYCYPSFPGIKKLTTADEKYLLRRLVMYQGAAMFVYIHWIDAHVDQGALPKMGLLSPKRVFSFRRLSHRELLPHL